MEVDFSRHNQLFSSSTQDNRVEALSQDSYNRLLRDRQILEESLNRCLQSMNVAVWQNCLLAAEHQLRIQLADTERLIASSKAVRDPSSPEIAQNQSATGPGGGLVPVTHGDITLTTRGGGPGGGSDGASGSGGGTPGGFETGGAPGATGDTSNTTNTSNTNRGNRSSSDQSQRSSNSNNGLMGAMPALMGMMGQMMQQKQAQNAANGACNGPSPGPQCAMLSHPCMTNPSSLECKCSNYGPGGPECGRLAGVQATAPELSGAVTGDSLREPPRPTVTAAPPRPETPQASHGGGGGGSSQIQGSPGGGFGGGGAGGGLANAKGKRPPSGPVVSSLNNPNQSRGFMGGASFSRPSGGPTENVADRVREKFQPNLDPRLQGAKIHYGKMLEAGLRQAQRRLASSSPPVESKELNGANENIFSIVNRVYFEKQRSLLFTHR